MPRTEQEAIEAVDRGDLDEIAKAMAEWSSERPWAERHWKNRKHWLIVAEAVMSNHDAVVEPIMAYVRARKAGDDPVTALDSLRASHGVVPEAERLTALSDNWDFVDGLTAEFDKHAEYDLDGVAHNTHAGIRAVLRTIASGKATS
jgi:hypothetical protein